MREVRDIVRELRNTLPIEDRPSAMSEDQEADTDSLKREVASLIEAAESERSGESGTLVEEDKSPSQDLAKSKENRLLLLDAIEREDADTFESLLSNEETSLVERDARDRTPLLLAAPLDKYSMVNMILTSNPAEGNIKPPAQTAICPSPGNHSPSNDTEIRSQRDIGLTAIDSIGRTVLHYCMEYGM